MNKVILMGNLTKDPEVRYSQSATPLAIARYGIAVKRTYTREGEPDTDFFNIVAFGKTAEFAEKFFKKGLKVCIAGRIQNNNWEDQNKVKHYSTEIIVDDQEFAESKSSFQARVTNRGTSYNDGQSNYGENKAYNPTPPLNDNDMGGFTPKLPPMEEENDLPF
ncbi:single-stranded DNA-binding protein [Candidatus Epulonipiscium viviparus]|uniref:single-stranded DNA-binding protein n=1 Tax=Candidatus Epulonipiscium viviparus TaxID=420336 RepID=UPI00016BFCC8|nr:single-stranded DNA-binding protein [Candidatus Epulopiscium viviparus]